MSALVQWLEQHMLQCPSKKLLVIDCPGCGLQRSILELLKGNLEASWSLYPPTIFILLTIAALAVHVTWGLKHGALLIKILFVLTTCVTAINYIYKIANHQLL